MDQRLLSLLTVTGSAAAAAAATAAVLHFASPPTSHDFLLTIDTIHRIEKLEAENAARAKTEQFVAEHLSRPTTPARPAPSVQDAFAQATREREWQNMKSRVDALCAKASPKDPRYPIYC